MFGRFFDSKDKSNTSFIKPIVRHETLRMREMSQDDFFKFAFSTSEFFRGKDFRRKDFSCLKFNLKINNSPESRNRRNIPQYNKSHLQ